ncbi:MAG: hypothetical protein HKN48_06860 [Flavobacteriaceae bacterium]|nr:hypothetical protein [Flavobacteriaceae bacterium]
MKKTQLLNWMLFALIAFGFTACDNEPLEGEFISEEDAVADSGQFIAQVDGTEFTAISATALYNTSLNTFNIAGTDANGAVIVLSIANPGVGTFDLTQIPNQLNSGVYYTANDVANPFVTDQTEGGNGILNITEFDETNLLVSGTFSFEAKRVVDNGNGPVQETKIVSNGSFTAIPFTVDSSGGGGGGNGGGGDPTDPVDSFYALVDGDEFEDIEVSVTQSVVGGINMLNVNAVTATGSTMRIDIPEGLGVGTYDFASISDGTELIALYDANTGGENLTSNPGTITITEYGNVTGKLAATFEFRGTDPLNIDPTVVEVTEGAFNVDFIENSTATENMFTADIDGINYVPSMIEITQEPFGELTLYNVTTVDEVSNQSLTISFAMDSTTGIFAMSPEFVDGTEKVGIYNPDIGNSILFRSNPGEMQILSYELSSGIIEATFQFSGVDPLGNDPTVYEITNGTMVIDLY